jgi:hypothetical protein
MLRPIESDAAPATPAEAEAAFWRRQAERLACEIARHRQNSAAMALELRPVDVRLYGVERAMAEQAAEHQPEIEPAPAASRAVA